MSRNKTDTWPTNQPQCKTIYVRQLWSNYPSVIAQLVIRDKVVGSIVDTCQLDHGDIFLNHSRRLVVISMDFPYKLPCIKCLTISVRNRRFSSRIRNIMITIIMFTLVYKMVSLSENEWKEEEYIQNKTEKANPELKIIWLTLAKVNKNFYYQALKPYWNKELQNTIQILIFASEKWNCSFKILSLLETASWKSMLILGHDAKF